MTLFLWPCFCLNQNHYTVGKLLFAAFARCCGWAITALLLNRPSTGVRGVTGHASRTRRTVRGTSGNAFKNIWRRKAVVDGLTFRVECQHGCALYLHDLKPSNQQHQPQQWSSVSENKICRQATVASLVTDIVTWWEQNVWNVKAVLFRSCGNCCVTVYYYI